MTSPAPGAAISELFVRPVRGLPEVQPGDDLAALLVAAVPDLCDGDVLVVTSKIVSKAEGQGRTMARDDAIAAETVRVVASRGNTRIVETRHGLVMAAAGVDASNVARGTVVLLPVDPDASASRLRATLAERLGVRVAVIISDTMGRPWREGLVDVAIGCAGLRAVDDLRGKTDAYGNELGMTVTATADELAAAGELVKGKLGGVPAALIRGAGAWVTAEDGPGARALVRHADNDMFRLGTAEAILVGQQQALASIGGRTSAPLNGQAQPSPETFRSAVAAAAAATESWVGPVTVSLLEDSAVRAAVRVCLRSPSHPILLVSAGPAAHVAAGATVAALLVALDIAGVRATWLPLDMAETAAVEAIQAITGPKEHRLLGVVTVALESEQIDS